jgi:hypothetical protein
VDTTRVIGLMAAAATVAGCNGFNRVSYTRTMPFGEVLMVDANQRAILAGEAVEVETDDGIRLRQPTICSEPSPDSITAATLAASGSVEHERVAAQASLALWPSIAQSSP